MYIHNYKDEVSDKHDKQHKTTTTKQQQQNNTTSNAKLKENPQPNKLRTNSILALRMQIRDDKITSVSNT
jgi:hypothetical protein